MKIKKGSENLGTIDFVCEYCTAEFSAEHGEYRQRLQDERQDGGWKKGIFGMMSDTALRKIIPSYLITVECPECQEEIEVYIPTGQASYIEEVYCGW